MPGLQLLVDSMKARAFPLLLAAFALSAPWSGRAAVSPFGPAPAIVRPGPPRLPTDPERWLPWRVFTWRDGVNPGNPALTQDAQGYIWADGPIRYNGRIWEKFEVPGEAGPVPSWSVLAGSDGSLWFGRMEGGLLRRFRNGSWARYPPGSGLPAGLVGALVEGSQGTLWVGTTTGLARCRGGHCVEVKALRGANVRALALTRAADGRTALWIGIRGGLLRLDGIDGPSPDLSPLFTDPAALPDLSVRGLAETVSPQGERALWIATDSGVARFRNGVWTRYDSHSGFPPGPVVTLRASRSRDGRPVVWAGSFRSGLLRFEEDGRWTVYDIRSGLPANLVDNLLLTPGDPDGEPTLWAATPVGLARLEHEHWNAVDSRFGLPNEVVIGLGEATFPDGLHTPWIGTVGGMIRLTPRGWERFAPSLEPIVALAAVNGREADGSEAFWIASVDGLHRFAHGSWTTLTPQNSQLPYIWVQTLLAIPTGNGTALWAATPQGLARYERGLWTAFRAGDPSGLPGSNVRALARTPLPGGGSVVWAGTDQGVGRFQGGTWEAVTAPCLPHPAVLALRPEIAPRGGGWLWIGTRGGVARLRLDGDGRPQGGCQALTGKTRPALPQPYINQIQIDAWGRVYLFTDWGVSRLTVAPGQGLATARVESFEVGDGLPGMDFHDASFIDHLGRIWGGATGGAAVLDPAPPEPAAVPRRPAPLRLEHILVAGRERPLPPGMALRHDENSVEFRYALLSYRREHATRYRTQLAGLEKRPSEWTPEAEAVYKRLPQGNYTFRVWGKDGMGTLSGPIEVRFRIRPAPWLSVWAIALYALALMGLGYGASHVKTLARRAASLETQVAERTRELAEANRQLELTSLTDPLTGLSNRRFLAVNIEPDVRQAVRNALGAGLQESNTDLLFYFLDIDHFKQLNDRAGHAGGDRVLVEVAGRLREAARNTDAVVRWGGEEFLIVSRWADRRSGEALAQRMLEAVAGEPFAVGPGAGLTVTCSIGWAPYPWRSEIPDAVHYEQVMSLADRALYLAKREGRNRAVGVLPAPDGALFPEGPLEEQEGRSVELLRSTGPAAGPLRGGASVADPGPLLPWSS